MYLLTWWPSREKVKMVHMHMSLLSPNTCNQLFHWSRHLPGNAILNRRSVLWLVHAMAWCLLSIRPVPESMITYHPCDSEEHVFNTLRPRQMDAISQTTFWNAFSWMKMFEFRLKFHWGVFLRFQLTLFQHWYRYWLGAVHATSHYLNQWWLVYWRIYASLGLNELNGRS